MSILVLGTVALDTVKTPHGLRKHMLGGSAVHFSMSARLFTDVHLSAIVGKDFPARHIEFLRRKGVILDSLIRSSGKTFKWEGEYEGDLNCALTKDTQLGVLLGFSPRIEPRQSKIKNIFLANVDPDIQSRLLDYMPDSRLIGLDSMNFWIHNKKQALLKLFKRVDIYVANDQEARDLTGESNLIKAGRCLEKLGPKMVLIKKGEHGVIFCGGSSVFCLPAYPVDKVIDPTGAGDTFAGGFIGYLSTRKKLDRMSIKRALGYGTIAASFNVEGFGVEKTARLRLNDLEKRLRAFRELVLF
ncbi:MAG: PfkB family carbohydrate kinase [Candidatus Omnitrophica bacterium]|jgi:sugar/nucleoside kinase (ribokinase family)|nr:PfkB family carbohydrate kinase [Candidatus Omnitrophota bacterium]MDD5079381.1 PfkB family carbohydrate kinase [Candidatus Omnitrophota bacterium]